ncbi:MAG: hypothetical protein IPG72_01390 [Ardenticatenales bacterium]|nr:hypothetical protein [Ardenticatenales bacterium]
MILRVCSWNLRKPGRGQAARRVQALRDLDCDVYLLQEVTPHVWQHIVASDFVAGRTYSISDLGIEPSGPQPHGAVVLARPPFRLTRPTEIPGLPKRERGLAALVSDGRTTVQVASWYAPNAAGNGVAAKMAAYKAVTRWLANIESPDVRVRACRYDLAAGVAAGSDHAVVRAEVEFGTSEGS